MGEVEEDLTITTQKSPEHFWGRLCVPSSNEHGAWSDMDHNSHDHPSLSTPKLVVPALPRVVLPSPVLPSLKAVAPATAPPLAVGGTLSPLLALSQLRRSSLNSLCCLSAPSWPRRPSLNFLYSLLALSERFPQQQWCVTLLDILDGVFSSSGLGNSVCAKHNSRKLLFSSGMIVSLWKS